MYHPAWNHHGKPAPRPAGYQASGQYLALNHQRGLGNLEGAVDALWSRPARVAASLALAYHGYRRNNSIIWGLVWAAIGAASPPFATLFAVAMKPGFARRK